MEMERLRMNERIRRLPLAALHNARELGGWHTPDGVTRCGVFLRTDMHAAPTGEDMAFLRAYGVTMDVDLRGASELEHRPDPLREEPWCEYVHVPMTEESAEYAVAPGKFRPKPGFTMGAEYVRMAEKHQEWVRGVFEALGRCEGAAMFHCTMGKDRTGLITALLLGLCGVSDEDIIADYCVTEVYMHGVLDAFRAKLPPEEIAFMEPLLGTPPSNMEMLLGHMREKYGGIPAYLGASGVSDALAGRIRARLLGKGGQLR